MLTWYETPARLKEIPDGLGQMEAEELRVLVIKGIADGNDPTARSQFLHATDSLQRAQNIYMERRRLYQPVIVRWPFAAVPEEYRWDIGGGSLKARGKLQDEDGDPGDIYGKLQRLRAYVDKDREIILMRRPASHVTEFWCIYKQVWRPACEWEAPRESVSLAGC